MEELLFHPKVVHLPIALAVLMPLIAGGLTVAWWRGWLPKKTWVVALALQGLLVASGAVAMQTGEVDEDRVERVVAESFIEEHEEAAEVFVWASACVLILVVAAGAMPKERVALGLATAATLGTLVVFALGHRVGEAGGDLVYEHGAANAYTDGAASSGPRLASEHDDDDDDDD